MRMTIIGGALTVGTIAVAFLTRGLFGVALYALLAAFVLGVVILVVGLVTLARGRTPSGASRAQGDA